MPNAPEMAKEMKTALADLGLSCEVAFDASLGGNEYAGAFRVKSGGLTCLLFIDQDVREALNDGCSIESLANSVVREFAEKRKACWGNA